MNKYNLRVFPGDRFYTENIISQHYYVDDFRINFYSFVDDDKIIRASYPSAIVIIESVEYDIAKQ